MNKTSLMRNQNGIASIALVVIALVVVGVAGAVGYRITHADNKHAGKTVATTKAAHSSTTTSGVKDCGTVTTAEHKLNACFDAQFKDCKPGTVIAKLPGSAAESISVKYEILGPKDGKCSVQYVYLHLPPNPSWENKALICSYENAPTFLESADKKTDTADCTGPLAALINS